MRPRLIKNAKIINESKSFDGSLLITDGKIADIYNGVLPDSLPVNCEVIDATGKLLIPGIIDDQVHFREPGLTHKGDIYTEARAGIAGGVTSFMEMPNTWPQTVTQELLEQKYLLASGKSLANYSFYMGATNDNLHQLQKTNANTVCGIKVVMGSSTGNMLVNETDALKKIFSLEGHIIAVHAEDEDTIQNNTRLYRDKYGENLPVSLHPVIRSAEACFICSSRAIELAKKYGTRLHVLHLSTEKEMELFTNTVPLEEKKITAEVCVHHLWFNESDYKEKGAFIKWNPAVKKDSDKDALFNALLNDTIDVIATDHAPHTREEKENSYFRSPSGGPMVQHSLVCMLEFHHQGKIKLEKIVEKMCHSPARLFQVEKRGFIRKGYWADLVLLDLNNTWTVNKDNILYKCGWSPMEGTTFHSSVTHTFVNGHL
ncbi:MAG: dihydroorotase, partial [Bacteroidota bacterium]